MSSVHRGGLFSAAAYALLHTACSPTQFPTATSIGFLLLGTVPAVVNITSPHVQLQCMEKFIAYTSALKWRG